MIQKERNRRNVSFVFFILGLLGIFYPFIAPDSGASLGPPFFFIGLIIGITALILVLMFHVRLKAAIDYFGDDQLLADWNDGETHILIYQRGFILDKEMVFFKPPYCELEGVGMDPRQKSRLIIVYRAMSGRAMRSRRIPVDVSIPFGLEWQAEQIIQHFHTPLPNDYIKRLREQPLDEEDD